MVYRHLPEVGALHLPELEVHLTGNSSPRRGSPIRQVWEHRWSGGTFAGVEQWFKNPSSQASSHFVYAGLTGPYAGRCAQMVPLHRKAWTEAWYNPSGVSIESADAIWLGHDPHGFAQLARITAYLLHHLHLPAMWTRGTLVNWGKGFCRHADGGLLGGGHTSCPTTDLEHWGQFVGRVRAELKHGSFRHHWEMG